MGTRDVTSPHTHPSVPLGDIPGSEDPPYRSGVAEGLRLCPPGMGGPAAGSHSALFGPCPWRAAGWTVLVKVPGLAMPMPENSFSLR